LNGIEGKFAEGFEEAEKRSENLQKSLNQCPTQALDIMRMQR
jgi:hypothetical protein